MKITGFVLLFFFNVSFAQEINPINWSEKNRVQFRDKILDCNVYFSPKLKKVNHSTGIAFSSNQPEDFEKSIKKVISIKGAESLKGGHFYVPVEYEKLKIFKNEYTVILKGHDLEEKVKVHFLAIPRHMIEKRVAANVKEVFQQMRYFLPSVSKNFEVFTVPELATGIALTAAIEAYGVHYLATGTGMDSLHSTVTISAYVTLLLTYEALTKTLRNWWLQPGTSKFESYIKSVLSGIPLILTLKIGPQWSKIVNFYQTHSWDETWMKFGTQLTEIFSSTGPEMLAFGLFDFVVISQGIGKWANTVEAKSSNTARVLYHWLSFPFFAFDAKFFAESLTSNDYLFELMGKGINSGHIGFAMVTAVGAIIYKNPRILDPTLGYYRKLRAWMFKSFHLDIHYPMSSGKRKLLSPFSL